jgi:hypothetical protein
MHGTVILHGLLISFGEGSRVIATLGERRYGIVSFGRRMFRDGEL